RRPLQAAARHGQDAHPDRHARVARAALAGGHRTMTEDADIVEFDDLVAMSLASAAKGPEPDPAVRRRLMARVAASPDPDGFAFRLAADDRWLPHPGPGIRMKILALNNARGYATLLLDVAPG